MVAPGPADLYDAQSTLRNDSCYQSSRDMENTRIHQYFMQPGAYGAPDINSCPSRRPELEHRNLQTKRGYGVADGCTIDSDSRFRNSAAALTNPREKHQLFTRLFQATPDLNSGLPRPDVESRLLQGDYEVSRKCTGGVEWDRPFLDMLPCVAASQTAEHIVPDWTWGGDATRDYVRRPEGCDLLRPQGGHGARGPV